MLAVQQHLQAREVLLLTILVVVVKLGQQACCRIFKLQMKRRRNWLLEGLNSEQYEAVTAVTSDLPEAGDSWD